MSDVFTDITGLRYHRTPPVVHEMFGQYPDISFELGKRGIVSEFRSGGHPFGAIGAPLHLLATDKREQYASDTFKFHVWSREIAPGFIWDTEYGISVASPLFTLLSMATHIPVSQVTMLLYEMMGTFAVYRPTEQIAAHLQAMIDAHTLPTLQGWTPMLAEGGTLTELWCRSPLVTLAEVHRFLNDVQGAPGVVPLRKALQNVYGSAASPFEVQTAMLLGTPSRRGGWGFGPFELNHRIDFTLQARRISGQAYCIADIYIEETNRHRPLVIECQGGAYHRGEERGALDDNRAMALQSMGYEVLRLRYNQIQDFSRVEDTAQCIARLLAMPKMRRAASFVGRARSLHGEVVVDWWEIGA